jgi:tetratricopeptide (TPR) repeat protein
VCVALLVLLVAACTLRNGFVSLDDSLYLGNRSVSDGLTLRGVEFALTSVSGLYWHPLAWLSLALDAELYGTNPAGYHFTSALLHALSAGLLFLVLTKLEAGRWWSAAGSLLWALHPLRVESFAWVAERKDVLCAFFFIAALLAYLHYAERPAAGRYATWTVLGILALLSKPAAVCLAPTLFLLDYWPLRRTCGVAKLIKEKAPLLILTALVALLTVYGQKQSGSMSHLADVPFLVRAENAPVSLVRYAGKVLWPVDLTCFYRYDKHPSAGPVIGSVLLLGAITLAVVRRRHRRPWLLIGWLWFIAALLPNIGLLQAGRQSIADRFTHLATIGATAALVLTASAWTGSKTSRKTLAATSICGTLAMLIALTVRQIAFWHDSFQLYEHAISVEDSDYVHAVLADALMKDHRYHEAESHLRRALDYAPNRPEYHTGLANVLLKTGRLEQAASESAHALRLAPKDVPAAETMGVVLFQLRNYRGVVQQFDRAVQFGADRKLVAAELNDMGASLASRQQQLEAELLIRKAVALDPLLAQARRNLVLVLLDQGRAMEAKEALEEAIRVTGLRTQYRDLIPGPRTGGS